MTRAGGRRRRARAQKLLEDPTVLDIARARGAPAGAVLIAFGISRGVSVIPKSVSEARLRENFAGAPLRLSAGDVARLLLIGRGHRFASMKHDAACPEHPFSYDEDAGVYR